MPHGREARSLQECDIEIAGAGQLQPADDGQECVGPGQACRPRRATAAARRACDDYKCAGPGTLPSVAAEAASPGEP